MTITLIIYLILSVYGLSYITAESFLTQDLRQKYTKNNKLRYLLNCIKCSAFWNSIVIIGLYIIHPYLIIPFMCVGSTHIIKSILPNNLF